MYKFVKQFKNYFFILELGQSNSLDSQNINNPGKLAKEVIAENESGDRVIQVRENVHCSKQKIEEHISSIDDKNKKSSVPKRRGRRPKDLKQPSLNISSHEQETSLEGKLDLI